VPSRPGLGGQAKKPRRALRQLWGWISDRIGGLYDRAGFYAPAFAAGTAANLVHLGLVAALVLQWRRLPDRPTLGRAVA
jgi:hypothetical protein